MQDGYGLNEIAMNSNGLTIPTYGGASQSMLQLADIDNGSNQTYFA